MKLRNKKTGEIIDIYKGEITLHYNQGRKTIHFKCLEDLEEWEDYEEPKEHSFYNFTPALLNNRKVVLIVDEKATREEAKKVLEKLKAWKRLKDNGFEFRRWDIIDGTINFMILPKGDYREKVYEDLRICFGGEE